MTPEQEARAEIDRLLLAAGWHVCDWKQADIHAACGVAIREFELAARYGTADVPLSIKDCAAVSRQLASADTLCTHNAPRLAVTDT